MKTPDKWRNAHDCTSFLPSNRNKKAVSKWPAREDAEEKELTGERVRDESFLIKSWPDCADNWKGPVTGRHPTRAASQGYP